MQQDDLIRSLYQDRNLVVQLAAKLATRLGYPVAWGIDPAEPGWPVLFIELPTGQVSWHVATSQVQLELPDSSMSWDGHDNREKASRITNYLKSPRGPAKLLAPETLDKLGEANDRVDHGDHD